MSEPIRASDLPTEDKRSEDEKRKAEIAKRAQRIRLKLAAARSAGQDVSGSMSNLGNLEARIARVNRQIGAKGKEKRG